MGCGASGGGGGRAPLAAASQHRAPPPATAPRRSTASDPAGSDADSSSASSGSSSSGGSPPARQQLRQDRQPAVRLRHVLRAPSGGSGGAHSSGGSGGGTPLPDAEPVALAASAAAAAGGSPSRRESDGSLQGIQPIELLLGFLAPQRQRLTALRQQLQQQRGDTGALLSAPEADAEDHQNAAALPTSSSEDSGATPEEGRGPSVASVGEVSLQALQEVRQALADLRGYLHALAVLDAADVAPAGPPPAAKAAVAVLPRPTADPASLPPGEACPVCQDVYEAGEPCIQLPCGHASHERCLLPWLELRNSCPICRFELPTDDVEYETMRRGRADDAAPAAAPPIGV